MVGSAPTILWYEQICKNVHRRHVRGTHCWVGDFPLLKRHVEVNADKNPFSSAEQLYQSINKSCPSLTHLKASSGRSVIVSFLERDMDTIERQQRRRATEWEAIISRPG